MSAPNNLTREEAAARSRAVSQPAYDVVLDLSRPDDPTYRSETTVRFRSPEPGSSTFIDLLVPSVERASLNGREIPLDAFDGGRLRVEGLAEENELVVVAQARYENTGVGLHRFVDPVDGLTYLYSNFEPFDAHRGFACFDQPDIKGRFRFTIVAPAEWEVLSGMALESIEEPGNGLERRTFEESPPMPSYITVVCAGPFHAVHDRHGDLDLGIYCRRSLAQHLDADEILEVTKQGLDFFTRAFDYPYAFGRKYDQIFVPEFNPGAMENAGLVTFHENYIFRGKVTDAQRERRADTILHEMAHMWFGDLVTMRWWDDLWLNESFATFMATLSQSRATRWTNAWTTFANSEKNWAYHQDQLPSTHPISTNMPDTTSIRTNFDGITYAKGASVLRQLVAWVGEEEFLQGVRNYFRRHEFGNTELSDFLGALEETSGRDLKAWAKEWLQTAGVNTLRPSLEVRDGVIASLAIEQSAPPEHPVLRSHRVTVGLYDRDGDALSLRQREELDVVGDRTSVTKLEGEAAADFVLVNDADLAYAKVRLDEDSLKVAIEGLSSLADVLARAVVWGACWDMVREAEMPAREFVRLTIGNAEAEEDVGVVQRTLIQAASAIEVYGDPANRDAARRAFADACLEALGRAAPGSDHQLAWARSFIRAASTDEHRDLVSGLLSGETSFDGLAVDTELRWHIVRSLAAEGAIGEAEIAAEEERDPTDQGHRQAAGSRAALPTAEAKAWAWERIVGDGGLPLAMRGALMGGFQQPGQRELLEPYVERYLERLVPMWEEHDQEVAFSFARQMYPALVIDRRTVDATGEALGSEGVPGPIRRVLEEGRADVSRALRAQDRDRATT